MKDGFVFIENKNFLFISFSNEASVLFEDEEANDLERKAFGSLPFRLQRQNGIKASGKMVMNKGVLLKTPFLFFLNMLKVKKTQIHWSSDEKQHALVKKVSLDKVVYSVDFWRGSIRQWPLLPMMM